ncbi:amino acid ABC transporter permease [Leekyejoonella antrihumi]|uniref:Amino acid ABC transporter permease n=1 Tax=Leekyejoonella antrihumi TaxID=1660198 RepID=A0A563DU87_9MICO|nr:amino acid ABC transporter permease [Leekyejoonella antrihumi]TWP33815.1 amino acid ABC transporter permease [Leekyejoonella antrihumi]
MNALFSQFDLWSAFWMTIKLTVIGAIGSLILGTLVAVLRLSPVRMLRAAGTAYVTVFRNTPLTLIVFACSLVLWQTLGITLANDHSRDFFTVNNFRLALVALIVYHASFVCEALRSGVNTIPLGQAEAARSIGLTFTQSLREVVLPQAFRGAVTPLGNTLIALTKNTTVVMTIGVAELAYQLARINEFRSDLLNLAFAVMAMLFVILTVPVGIFLNTFSKRLAVKR